MEIFRVIYQADLIRGYYDTYCLQGDAAPLSVDDYVNVIKDYSSVPFELFELDAGQKHWKAKQIKGGIARYCDRAEIYVAAHRPDQPDAGITLCEKRFITLKELSHLLIDDEDSYLDSVTEWVNHMIYGDSPFNGAVESGQSETMACLFAMELLFPWQYRESLRKKINDPNDPCTSLEVARKFKVPLTQLVFVLTDAIHNELTKQHKWLDDINKTYSQPI